MGQRYINPHLRNQRRGLIDFFLWKTGFYNDRDVSLPPPADFLYPSSTKTFERDLPNAVWIGHSTYLLEINGLHILTDPVWDNYCSPVPLSIFKRQNEAPILLEDLPPIDIVLLSHNHYDHLDAKTTIALHRFHPQIEWVVPSGLSPWFRRKGIHAVTEIGWWQSYQTKNAKITAVPTQHFSGRTLWDKNKTHWNGYVLEKEDKRVYFTGDTGYNEIDFKAIGARFPKMDLSLIPIGTYVPKKFMETVHIGPREAVQIHKDVNSLFSLGMHWNTFRLSDEPMNRPPYDLYLEMEKNNLPFESFLPIDIGTYVNF